MSKNWNKGNYYNNSLLSIISGRRVNHYDGLETSVAQAPISPPTPPTPPTPPAPVVLDGPLIQKELSARVIEYYQRRVIELLGSEYTIQYNIETPTQPPGFVPYHNYYFTIGKLADDWEQNKKTYIYDTTPSYKKWKNIKATFCITQMPNCCGVGITTNSSTGGRIGIGTLINAFKKDFAYALQYRYLLATMTDTGNVALFKKTGWTLISRFINKKTGIPVYTFGYDLSDHELPPIVRIDDDDDDDKYF